MIDNALQAFLLRPCNPDVVPMIYFGIVVPGNDPLHAKAAMYHFNTAPGMGIEEDGTDTLLKWAQHGPRDKLKDLSYLETTAPMPLFQVSRPSCTLCPQLTDGTGNE